MLIIASDYSTFADAIAAAYATKYVTGSAIYLPGKETPYDGDGLTLPANTQLTGDGSISQISGRMTIGSAAGQQQITGVSFLDGCDVYAARNTMFQCCDFQGTVKFTEPSYYNTFHTCRWRNLGTNPAIEVIGLANFNRLHGCRINHEGIAVKFTPDPTSGAVADGWGFQSTSFEGAGAEDAVLGSALDLQGRWHHVSNCWFERGADRTYGSPTIKLRENTKFCVIDANVMGYLVTVEDKGQNNDIRGYFETRRAD